MFLISHLASKFPCLLFFVSDHKESVQYLTEVERLRLCLAVFLLSDGPHDWIISKNEDDL